ncbi:hypothetical protein HFO32_21625 [Rhizobium leguminosarum]|uniref:hypothetical protein n=1 Tax=Rhizobium leguminosarum TaxID=384 RepID=UPI001C974328|nr:hypothetical protein [Rhizobium leguminosarum]MBY5610527.1 hypothetical protein [Rhizobium leguminosarum]MBY5655419.1 hypothetical protein [Rhizobium leguminosarum]MBY5670213.1 hypothetical protein [Rhizobium leguminosarum]MBY5684724.1 hypothetical protein [Rhizobium leguminosarum]
MYFIAKPGESPLLFSKIPPSPIPDADLDAAIAIPPDMSMKAVGADETKVWLELETPDLAIKSGWVKASRVVATEPPGLEELDPPSFVKNCTLAARVFNQTPAGMKYGINRDFLIAYALVQTGTDTNSVPRNVAQDFSPGPLTGPFALSQIEWTNFVESSDNTDHYVANDISTPIYQCYGFAFIVGKATQALSEKFTVTAPESSGPYIPNSVELFLYLVTGEAAAFAVVAGATAHPDHPIVPLLTQHLGDRTDAVLSRYRRFFGSPEEARSVKAAMEKIAAVFDEALKRSFSLVRDLTPEDVIYFVSGTLPWMVRAREELTKGVHETKNPANAEILKYFGSTGHVTQNEDAWCGAFVAWCIANCGSELAAKSVRKETAATAASWKSWGDTEVSIGTHEKDAIPEGAVVVLRPQDPNSDTTGHVAFYVDQTATDISLLGGNQSNSVKISTFPRAEVVAIRMLKGFDAVPSLGIGPGATDPNFEMGTMGPFTKEDWAKYIDVLGKRESTNNYRGENQYGYIGRWQFGADALIDGKYVKAGATPLSLIENHWWLGKLDVGSREDWLSNKNKCQDIEMVAYTKRNYRSLLNIRVTRTMTQNATKAVLAGLLATSHLLGTGGTRKMVLGQDGSDANGVTGREYFQLLSEAFGGPGMPPQGGS